jgi:hypothetical protein
VQGALHMRSLRCSLPSSDPHRDTAVLCIVLRAWTDTLCGLAVCAELGHGGCAPTSPANCTGKPSHGR